MAPSTWKIVIGSTSLNKRPKRYIKKTDPSGKITYHHFRSKTYCWKTKYGHYNTIKEKAGTATFYNVGKEVEADIKEELEIVIDAKDVSCGYNYQ